MKQICSSEIRIPRILIAAPGSGSGHAMPEILSTVLAKNPAVRTVVTCVTLETLSQTLEALRKLPVTEPQVRQIAVTRAHKMGSYHMMKALNPIYLIDFEGKVE